MKSRVLVVDDEPAVRLGLRRFLEKQGYEVHEAAECSSAEQVCSVTLPDVAILDQRLPDGDGIDLLPRLKDACPGLGVIMLTAYGSIDLAVRAIREGAEQFLTKPLDLQAVGVIVERLVEDRRNRQRQLALRATDDAFDPFLGTSRSIRMLSAEAHRLVDTDSPVLILGETGAGKGVMARWLHDGSPRSAESFVDLNCAALSHDLLESELFGHEAGAFTGATKKKVGLLEVANHGTVFLDEIGDMDLAIQARLLKVLEEKRFRRLGDTRDRVVDVRLIAATNGDLRRLITEKRFREDLYFRISTLPLAIPPLRERREDIPDLARDILRRSAARRAQEIGLSDEALAELGAYAWPGNIRELRNVLERAILLCEGHVIRPSDFRFGGAGSALAEPPPGGVATLEQVERDHIARVLEIERGHVARAAAQLGVSTSSLYDRIKRYGIALPKP
jgi:DNA-binding NtrC family response regulator